jgi:hypothetical protein
MNRRPNDADRARLTAVADAILPATSSLPAPSSVGIATAQLDRVLRAAPELTGPLLDALDRLAGDPDAGLRALRQVAPAAFSTIMLVVTSGYYMAPDVRRAIGYGGQEALRVDAFELPAYLEDGSLERVIARGALYRDVKNEGE